MSTAYDVIVVGCGITGVSTSYHLKNAGVERVLLIERAGPAAGGTGHSAAIVRQHYSNPVMIRVATESLELFARMEDELGKSGGYVPSGWRLLVPESLLAGARKNVALQLEMGVDTRFLNDGERDDLADWLNPQDIAAIVYEPRGGYADPVQTTEAFLGAYERAGGEVRLNTPVRALLREGGRITGVLLDDGPVAAGAVVNAAGPWAKPLAESVDLELRLRSVREQDTIWEARPNRPLPTSSLSSAVDAFYLRPMGPNRFIVGRGFPKTYFDVDPYNYKATADDDFVGDVLTRLETRIPPLAGARLINSYAALYDITPDYYPFVGPRSGVPGYYDANGGSGHGFKIGPSIGRHLASWIVAGEIDEDFARLSYDRIAQDNLFVHSYGGNRG